MALYVRKSFDISILEKNMFYFKSNDSHSKFSFGFEYGRFRQEN